MKQIILSSLVLALIGIIGSPFVNGDITMILSNAGYNVPAWVSTLLLRLAEFTVLNTF